MDRLPGILGEIADVAGEEAALALARVRGGTQIYLPPRPADDHWICELIGKDRALAVCEHLTGGVGPLRLDLPVGPEGFHASQRAKVDALIRDGSFSERQIALQTRYTTRGIRKRIAKQREIANSAQIKLL